MEFKPIYYAALESLSRGGKTAGELAEELDLEPHDAEAVLAALAEAGLVEKTQRGLLAKKTVYSLTPQGWRTLAQWREKAREDVEKAAELRRAGREEEAEQILQLYEPAIPLMLAAGILNTALLTALALEELEAADGWDQDVAF
ncbi:MarR family transcriptional regulator [Pyrobaculum neutrophilum]|uniref:Uncharacterized protein n=1 Tax=Pyrobaculum neutrophilum (strain DSM 2338 / JCM 9278 / NBRC 100436 / V24Sta) TaxID=444157 RepID=B1YBZ8_PYRNV|nr:MarR family transcriptional regulator [Pyrobaculum neutrophilum]ACB39382.1 conserved hypothetical protein [Pyrobaculum neutrophilum V24Sta]